MGAFRDLTNERRGNLVVLWPIGPRRGRLQWHCRCDCGRECSIAAHNLAGGNATSCGCKRGRRNQYNRPQQVLAALVSSGLQTMAQLDAGIGCGQAKICYVLKRLQARGLVMSYGRGVCGRPKRYGLTEAGAILTAQKEAA